jgi:hypothetical protein
MPWPLNAQDRTSVLIKYVTGQTPELVLAITRHAQKNTSGNVTFTETITQYRLHVSVQSILLSCLIVA